MCHLTGIKGVYVNAHLIPKALTRPSHPGNSFIQSGAGTRPVRRWDSWSDRNLVIQKGEDILSDLDNWAIPILRQHQLVWSGWNGANCLPEDYIKVPGADTGVRKINLDNPNRMRTFFLSLLWRAASTSRPEFSQVNVSTENLETLRKAVLTGETSPLSFYPCQLVQHSTRGEAHNLAPIVLSKPTAFSEDGQPLEHVFFFRFYFEGLIAHFLYFEPGKNVEKYVEEVRPLLLGGSKELTITVVPYENSFQEINLRNLVVEAYTQFPEMLLKLTPKRRF